MRGASRKLHIMLTPGGNSGRMYPNELLMQPSAGAERGEILTARVTFGLPRGGGCGRIRA